MSRVEFHAAVIAAQRDVDVVQELLSLGDIVVGMLAVAGGSQLGSRKVYGGSVPAAARC